MRKTKTITEYIKMLSQHYSNKFGITVQEINNGQCCNFADEIKEYGYGEVYWGDEIEKEKWSKEIQNIWPDWFEFIAPYHAFILYKGKYYDSESPKGVDSPEQLMFFQREINHEPWVIECLKDNDKCIYMN